MHEKISAKNYQIQQPSGKPWLTKAKAYEKRLGVYAYSHPRSKRVLTLALNKMVQVIRTHYNVSKHKYRNRKQREYRDNLYKDVFTKNDPGSAGQIGKDATFAEINTMLTTGNLRERMTAFYNAVYYNNSPGSPPVRGFKAIVGDILFNNNLDLATELNLDQPDLTAKSAFLRDSWLRWGLKVGTGLTSRGYNFADDPFALGNLTLAQEGRGTGEMGLSQYERINRPASKKTAKKRTAQDYVDLRIPLSPREEAYTARELGINPTDPNYFTTKLPWEEGHTYYNMVPTRIPGMSWIGNIRDTLRMPVVAGVSGTTTRMLTAFKWLKTNGDPIDFRLALMGWMLPAWDHSLYEILRGSHLAGVKDPNEGNLTDVVDMYMNVPPLTTDELRAHVAVNKQFPHEEIYMERMNTITDSTGFRAMFDTNADEGTQKYHISGATNPNFSPAHATAIYGYTTGIHAIMNAVLTASSEIVGKRIVANKLKAYARQEGRIAYLKSRIAYLKSCGNPHNAEQAELNRISNKLELIDVLKKEKKLREWKTHCGNIKWTSDDVNK